MTSIASNLRATPANMIAVHKYYTVTRTLILVPSSYYSIKWGLKVFYGKNNCKPVSSTN